MAASPRARPVILRVTWEKQNTTQLDTSADGG